MKTATTRLGFRPAILCLVAALSLVAPNAPAQLVNDGETNVISGVTNVVAGDLTVGTNGVNTMLIISNGGTVDSMSGYIGYNPGFIVGQGDHNTVIVSGPNSAWNNSSVLNVGLAGSFNTLLITNGGIVNSVAGGAGVSGYIGWEMYASNNAVAVVGPNSAWNNTGVLSVGDSGSFNSLLIAGGGTVSNTAGVIGEFGNANFNAVTVSDTNSAWNNSGDLYVGDYGSFNTLLLTNGGMVNSIGGYIGFGVPGNRSVGNNNAVTVSGTNSTWNNGANLVVGGSGLFNSLLITSGGTVLNVIGSVGSSTAARSNAVTVSGPGASWTSSGLLSVGESGSFNTLLITDGGVVYDSSGIIGKNVNGSNNGVTMSGTNSLWTNSSAFAVGDQGAFNFLVVSNGATVANTTGNVGIKSNANGNVASITGSGSLWSNRGNLFVGSNGSMNQLIVSNGGLVVVSNFAVIGSGASSSGNRASVSGTGSRWLMGGYLSVGSNGFGNRLAISEGGVVMSSIGQIGFKSASSNNEVLVDGAGSIWSNSSQLFVGREGSGNRLTITNGGRVVSPVAGYVGYGLISSNNSAVATGAGTSWDGGPLVVGQSGNWNHLRIAAGATVTSPSATIGDSLDTSGPYATGNEVTVDGPGSLWVASTGSQFLEVGSFRATQSRMLITNGGTVISRAARIGFIYTFDNEVRVVGAGSLWSNRFSLVIGEDDGKNRLYVEDGGRVISDSITLGTNGGASVPGSNELHVVGAGSVVSNRGSLVIGVEQSFNRLLILDGASVYSSNAIVGSRLAGNPGTVFNTALIDGTNSSWRSAGSLVVGSSGNSNRLSVTNGAALTSVGATIGSGGIGNQVWVAGPGSYWSNSGALTVGVGISGSQNALIVSDGAAVFDTSATIGSGSFSTSSNRVWVTGAGSQWLSTGTLTLGAGTSTANTLVISNGGSVVSAGGTINSGANSVIVTGLGSIWTNSGPVTLASGAPLNLLVVSNGAQFHATNLTVFADMVVAGGSVYITNPAGTGKFERRLGGTSNVLQGGTMVADQFFIRNGSAFFFNEGLLRIATSSNSSGSAFVVGDGVHLATLDLVGGGEHSLTNGLVISTGATLTGNGTIVGTMTNFGTISAGSSAGSIRINGDLSLQSSSMMSFEIGGLIATNDYDQLIVTNFAELAGTLSLALLPNYLPNPQDSFTVLRFNTYSSAFANAADAPGARVSLTNNLASFAVIYVAGTGVTLGGVTYADTDADGQGDLQEQAAGTDAASQASAMKITALSRTGGGPVTVTFQSVVGKNYRIEYSNDLITWSIATAAVTANGVGNSTHWIDDGSLTGGLSGIKRFYRIGLQ